MVGPPESAVCAYAPSPTERAISQIPVEAIPVEGTTSAVPSRRVSLEPLAGVARMLVVGLWSSGIDLVVLASCVRGLGMDSTISRLIALAVSGLALFYGCRSFAFRAQAGCISRQAKLFAVAELMGLPLNLLAFHLLATHVPSIAPEFLSQAGNFLVFMCFGYPVRRLLVFRLLPRTAAG